MLYKNKTAIVTGGGSGIGRALVEALARRGAVVVAADINVGRAEDAADAVKRAGGRCEAAALDVTDAEAVAETVRGVAERHGRVDFMFNNAGIAIAGQARDLSLGDWRDVIEVNLFGVINGIQAVYPLMIRQGAGHIVNTASVEGLVPFVSNLPYTASKFAVVGLSGALRTEAKQHGVRVSVVCPGYTDTPIFEESRVVRFDRKKAFNVAGWLKPTPVRECARKILEGVERNRPIIVVSDAAKLAWAMSRISPELTRKILEPRLKMILDTRIEDD